MTCYDTCPDNTTPIENTENFQIQFINISSVFPDSYSTEITYSTGISVCKPNSIYVDMFANNDIHLGTVDYPYQRLDQAIYDLYNYPNDTGVEVNLFKIANTEFKINIPMLFKNTSVTFNVYSSTSSHTINFYPSNSTVFTLTGIKYRTQGPSEYVDLFDCLSTSYSTIASPYINLYNSSVTFINIILNFNESQANMTEFDNLFA